MFGSPFREKNVSSLVESAFALNVARWNCLHRFSGKENRYHVLGFNPYLYRLKLLTMQVRLFLFMG